MPNDPLADLRVEPTRGAWRGRLPAIHERLLRWYATRGRDLPWRRTRDPYAILVSEIMLQQTQVERVIPKYRQFLAHFPSLAALAAAPRAEVIRLWAPLGYNRRAVRLHALAQRVVEQCSGRLPAQPEELARLDGLGAYTSAAVACFAFDHQVGVVDTNVRRVLGRLLADHFDRAEPGPRDLARAADEALPAGRAADWNQALMDLGATVCTARHPACHACPVANLCAGRPRSEAARTGPSRRAAEARTSYQSEGSFLGSSRFYRGRIVQHLRELPNGASQGLDELGAAVRSDFSPEHRGWLLGLVNGLATDGLLRVSATDPASAEAVRVALP